MAKYLGVIMPQEPEEPEEDRPWRIVIQAPTARRKETPAEALARIAREMPGVYPGTLPEDD